MNGSDKILMWVQLGGEMAKLVETTIDKVKAMAAAGGATEAEQDAALDRVHGLYQSRIAREQARVDGAK
ncbi:MAG: hypothetical protein AB7N65_27215 [Vicinamibacterales bacterium]